MVHRIIRGAFSRARWFVLAFVVIGLAWAIRHWSGVEGASAGAPSKPVSASTASPKGAPPVEQKDPIVALVNGQSIMRAEVVKECLRVHGEEVLESMVNRRLIGKHCKDNGISVTKKEIDDEIDRIARNFRLPADEYLRTLENERGIRPSQYGMDVIWPTLALRKLAAPRLTVSPQELADAYESQFGPAVKARLIVLDTEKDAKRVWALAKAKPEEFGALAGRESKDVNSASSNGLIQPIRRHLGDPKVEEIAFQLQPGEISPIIPIANQFAILKCDGHMEAVQVDRKRFDALMTEKIKDRKLRTAASDTFNAMQKGAKVDNVMNNPELRRRMPGVAATVNGEPITLADLGDQCLERHGKDVLDGIINRSLLEQALKRRKLTVTDEDIDAEIERAAIAMGQFKPNKQPDVKGWLEMVQKTQGISEDAYIRDVVWPSTVMKKIVGNNVQVSEEDLAKGFEANYGPRVRCRWILFNSQKKAQEVWDMARQQLTVEKFAQLAEQYSIEANSRSLGGEIPPIQRYSGHEVLERNAFALRPGELSGVIQVGDNFAILYCEGFTTPVKVDKKAVQSHLYADLLEKKQRLEMAETFEKIKADATIDNYLAGTSQSPKRDKEMLQQDLLAPNQLPPRSTKRLETVRGGTKR